MLRFFVNQTYSKSEIKNSCDLWEKRYTSFKFYSGRTKRLIAWVLMLWNFECSAILGSDIIKFNGLFDDYLYR